MSREAYNSLPNIGTLRGSPGNRARRLTELPQVDNSPSRDFQRGSPLGKTFTKITKKKSSVNHFTKFFLRHAKHPHINIFTSRYSTLSLMSSPTYLLIKKTISTSTLLFLSVYSQTTFSLLPPTSCNFVI